MNLKMLVEIYYKKKTTSSPEYKVFLENRYLEKEKKFRLEIYKRVDELKRKGDKLALNQLKKELKKIYRTIDLLKEHDVIFLTTQKFLYKIYDPFSRF